MTTLRNIASLIILPCIMFSFSQCSSQKRLQQKAPMQFNEVYCQSWISGARGGGSGINIFIPAEAISKGNIELDSVYFRGKSAKLETKPQNETLYIGRFLTAFNRRNDVVMSSDGKTEYGNKMPEIPEKIPFELKENECVISYKEGDKTKYYKIENVVEKTELAYPQSLPNKR